MFSLMSTEDLELFFDKFMSDPSGLSPRSYWQPILLEASCERSESLE